MRIRFRLLASFLIFFSPLTVRAVAQPPVATGAATIAPAGVVATVILVRHAEKADAPADDPPLTAAGQARAQALAAAVADAGVTAVYSTRYLRTQQTAAPAAAALGITVTTLDPPSRGAAYGADYAREIVARNRGGVILVVGHSNTVPQILTGLGVSRQLSIADNEYSHMLVVTITEGGQARVVRSSYGER